MTGQLSAEAVRRSTAPPRGLPLPLIYLSLLVLVAFAMRVLWLDVLPRSLSMDESADGLDALQLVRTGWLTPFLQSYFGRETLFFYVEGIALQVFGISAFALRYASTLVGTLAIPLMYAVGRKITLEVVWLPRPLAGPLTGLLAATGMAICYWHVYFSRQAFRAILLLSLLLATVWCFWQGHQVLPTQARRGQSWLAMAGLLLGLSMYTYPAARVLPVLFLVMTAVWLAQVRAARRPLAVGLALFWSTAVVVSLPLMLYFIREPQAFASRADAIAISFGAAFVGTLAGNLRSWLLIQFGGGRWLGQWPSLNLLSGLGLLAGLLICVRHFRRPAAWFSLAWWSLGFAPVLLSRQDWDAVTTILRGIVAWPAVCLLSAIGLTACVGLVRPTEDGRECPRNRWSSARHRLARAFTRGHPGVTLLALPTLALLLGGAASVHDYFSIWANRFDPPGNPARQIARYLNDQTDRLTLCPNHICTASTTSFLLQARYPRLESLSPEAARDLLASGAATVILPREGDTPSAWLLLAPRGREGIAYVLPQLTNEQTAQLAARLQSQAPQATITDEQSKPVADVSVLDTDPAALWGQPIPMQAFNTVFADAIRLNAFDVEPAVAKRGQNVGLRLNWQAIQPIDGDYDVFIHLFNVQSGRRVGQVNETLGSSILLPSSRWPAGLSVSDLHYFTLPPDAPEGTYRFEVGLYHRASLERLPLIRDDGRKIVGGSVVLGKFRLQDRPPQPPTLSLSVPFEDSIVLSGLDWLPVDAGRISLVLHWQARGSVARDYTVFLHLVDLTQGNLVAQQDNMPQGGTYPTSLWSTGEEVLDPYVLSLPVGLPDGRYTLRIGLYDVLSGQRLRLKNQAGDYTGVSLRSVNGQLSLSEVGQ